METDILIVGGGLAGLGLAEKLQDQERDYLLVEARDRIGGRILTHRHLDGYFDMGPAWFWPGQPRIAALNARLKLEQFDQYAEGLLVHEDERGRVQRGRGYASMQGSYRLKNGLGALTDALAETLPANRIRLQAGVDTLTRSGAGVIADLTDGERITAGQVVLALPPRVATKIAFVPALPDQTLRAMTGIATWMAGQAKALAIYDRPFWRDAGLSGDAMSRVGPMVEVHDASPAEGGPYALFGFIGVPPERRSDEQLLKQHILAQLGRLFGDKASRPAKLHVKDWALDGHTATEADKAPLYAHPHYGLAQSMQNLWDGRLHFGGTEVAPQFGGYLEGALEAAENALDTLNRTMPPRE